MVHTVDASQVVPAAAALVSEKKDSYIAAVKARQEELRNRHENKPVRDLLPLKEARELRWKGAEGRLSSPPCPHALGPVSIGSLHGSVSCGCCSDDPRYYVTVQELIGHIDWTPFFHAWELHGSWNRASQEFRTKDPSKAEAAAALYQDARDLLDQAVKENRYQARGVIGIFPANSTASHDDITVWTDESRNVPQAILLTQRQQLNKQGKTRLALADFIAPEGVKDYVGAMAVSIHGSRRWAKEWEARNDSYRCPAGQLPGGPPGGGFRFHRPWQAAPFVEYSGRVRGAPRLRLPPASRTTRRRKPCSTCSMPGRKRA